MIMSPSVRAQVGQRVRDITAAQRLRANKSKFFRSPRRLEHGGDKLPVRALAEVGWQRAALGEARRRALGDERGSRRARSARPAPRASWSRRRRPTWTAPAGCVHQWARVAHGRARMTVFPARRSVALKVATASSRAETLPMFVRSRPYRT